MRFATMRPFADSGTPRPVDDKKVREARVVAARRTGWKELDRARLVDRGRGWLVDMESDEVYSAYAGMTFERGSARLIADQQPHLAFYVDETGWPVVLESVGRTWSAMTAKRSAAA